MRTLLAFAFIFFSSASALALPPCSTYCPTATNCTDTLCEIAPGEPESCDIWCFNFPGDCAVCEPCIDDCDDVCAGAGATCGSFCQQRSGGVCNVTTCGDEGLTPPMCANQPDRPLGSGPCCNAADDACTCDDFQPQRGVCGSTFCNIADDGAPYTVTSGCTPCDDGNPCTLEACNPMGGVCESTGLNDGYTEACYEGTPGTEGIGECYAGTHRCVGGMFDTCAGQSVDTAESCDGLDNDCDATPDNGVCSCTPGDTRGCYGGPAATRGRGDCQDGMQTCGGTGVWGACTGQILPTVEVCDNKDNDCDNVIDSFLEACYTGPAPTRNIGICRDGVRSCSSGVYGSCTGQTLPAATETCGNAKDDDCDGVIDNGCPPMGPQPETCNGIDDDLNGVVDDGEANNDCPMGQICEWGTCFDDCSTTMMCGGMEICYADDFRCDGADPCGAISCIPGDTCFAGSCYTACTSTAECDPADELCYNSGRCGSSTDACEGVQCPVTDICYGGGCFTPCSDADPCAMPQACYAGRCAVDPCDDVDCPKGEVCAGGACFTSCSADAECDPDSACYAGRCAPDACADIQCPSGTTCFGGFCAPTCTSSAECGSDECFDVTGDNVCVDASDPCAGVVCGTTESCYGGSCYTTCTMTAQCDPDSVCYDNRCVSEDNPQCDGVLCPVGDVCFGGACVPTCTSDMMCDPSSYCYQGACVVDDCTSVTCLGSDVCYRGVCYQACDASNPCDAPDGCFEGRCAPSACEAQAATYIANYNTGHPFREFAKRLRAYQAVTPWLYGRAFSRPGDDALDFVNAPPAGLYRTRKARVVIYREDRSPVDKYSLFLTHGGTSSQGSAEAVYSMQVWGASPSVLRTLVAGAEGHIKKDSGDDPMNITALITSGANQPGGVLIGEFDANTNWTVKLSATFHGDIDEWQLVNGETGEVYTLNANYPLMLKSEDFAASNQLSPEIGTPCQGNSPGICQAGTNMLCENHASVCAQTVFPQGFEFCDGVDNDCDGAVDEADTDLRVPMVYRKQGRYSGWQTWLTYDTAGSSRTLMNYTPSAGDDRLGSTDVTLPGVGAIQTDVDQSHAFTHRDLKTGRVTVPFVHGKKETRASWDSRYFEFDLEPSRYDYIEDLYIAWYEDRKPGSTNDEIPEYWDADDIDLGWEVVRRDGDVESDAAVVGVDWYGPDVYFRVKFDMEGDNEDDEDDENPYTWLAWAPGAAAPVELRTDSSLRVLFTAARLDETACLAANTTAAGCPLGRYICGGGELRCSAASDLACNTCIDSDGDGDPGYDASLCPEGTDCNDEDPNIGGGLPELCNGIDDNCDGLVDITTVGCPDGKTQCGPDECRFLNSCVCPDGPEDETFDPSTMESCYCGEGLTP